MTAHFDRPKCELKKVIGPDKNNVESVSNEISENIDLIPILCEENNILKTKIQQLEVIFWPIRSHF